METRNIKELKEHPENKNIYGDSDALKSELINDIKEVGILVPIVINQKNTIISGHRRFKVAKHLNLESVPVQPIKTKNKLHEIEMLLRYNLYREEKTVTQKTKEYRMRKKIEADKAKERQKAAGGDKRAVKAKIPEPPKPQSKDIAAKDSGLGHRKTADKAVEILEAAEKGDGAAQSVLIDLDSHKITQVGRAYSKWKDEIHEDTPEEIEEKKIKAMKAELRKISNSLEYAMNGVRKLKDGEIYAVDKLDQSVIRAIKGHLNNALIMQIKSGADIEAIKKLFKLDIKDNTPNVIHIEGVN
jgi:hypothetical protein